MKKEQRQNKRFAISSQVRISARTLTGVTPVVDYMSGDISVGGIFIKTTKPLPIASRVSLELLLSQEDMEKLRFILSAEDLRLWKDDKMWVRTSGIVMRVEAEGVAVMFDQDYRFTPVGLIPS